MQIKTPYYPKRSARLVLLIVDPQTWLTFMKFSMMSRRFIATRSGNQALARSGHTAKEDGEANPTL
jgi:hypothetical protein